MELSILAGTHIAILTALATGLGLAAKTAQAYPVPVDFDGKVIRWDVPATGWPLYYETVNDSTLGGDITESMVANSASLWSGISGSVLRLSSITTSPLSSPSITVNFKSEFDGGQFAAAYAEFDEIDDEGRPLHCSIKVAIRGGEKLEDLEKTVLHEMGHCLGLGHSLFPKAIMSYRLEQNAFAIDVDDAAALRRLYPENGYDTAIPPGCTIGSAVPEGRPNGAGNSQTRGMTGFLDPSLVLMPALIALLTRRRQRG